jgi:hypothetical protein
MDVLPYEECFPSGWRKVRARAGADAMAFRGKGSLAVGSAPAPPRRAPSPSRLRHRRARPLAPAPPPLPPPPRQTPSQGVQLAPACAAVPVRAFPTWVIGAQVIEGEMTFDALDAALEAAGTPGGAAVTRAAAAAS